MRFAVGLGSSLGDRRAHLELAVRKLHVTRGLRVLRTSRWYRSPPLPGGAARNWFLNGVTLLEGTVTPEAVLARCRELEDQAGRRRARFWGDRSLDLDLLLAEGVISDTPSLTLPHAGIAKRSFVLQPLLEVWPDAVDPRTERPWAEFPTPPGPRLVAVGVAAHPGAAYPAVPRKR